MYQQVFQFLAFQAKEQLEYFKSRLLLPWENKIFILFNFLKEVRDSLVTIEQSVD